SDKNAAGIEFLFKKNKVDYIRGEASLEKPGAVVVRLADRNTETHTAANILIATGVLDPQPKSMVIIGAGAIGVEFAYFYNAFGTKVTLVELLPNILPVEDTEVSQTLEKALTKQGIKILTQSKTTKAEVTGKGVNVTIEGKTTEKISADVCLVAIGVTPLLPNGKLQPKLTERGYIETNDRYETSLPNVYAAGDIIGPPWLAHVASWEAIQAMEGMFDKIEPRKVRVFPGCTYCQPQVASVGLTERAAKESSRNFRVGKFPFSASGKARAIGETDGFVKLIIGEPHGEILGAHIIGPEATEMIAELGLAMTLEATHEEIEATIHAHPTLSEAVHEATGQAFGHAIHI
ncbi:MAG TPA: FAD-dependent oxidoreductase, partial [Chthoniobacterales bacterium]|nr:FAD-dependent oxidoreductase [Chthoniobacterales bacterium]